MNTERGFCKVCQSKDVELVPGDGLRDWCCLPCKERGNRAWVNSRPSRIGLVAQAERADRQRDAAWDTASLPPAKPHPAPAWQDMDEDEEDPTLPR